MCVSVQPADFGKTQICVFRTWGLTGELVDVVIYGNQPQSESGPNCMILHVPTLRKMGRANFLDMTKAVNALDDMHKAVFSTELRGGADKSVTLNPFVLVFDVGIYTVVVAPNGSEAQRALIHVPENKRPVISSEFMAYYDKLNMPIVLCCFDNKQSVNAAPFAYWYVSRNPKVLVAPGLDAHDGRLPVVGSEISVDHEVYFSISEQIEGSKLFRPVRYSDLLIPLNLRWALPSKVAGKLLKGRLRNGDYVVEVAHLRSRIATSLNVDRVDPFTL